MRRFGMVALCCCLLIGCSAELSFLGPSREVIEYGSIEGLVRLSDGGVAGGIAVRLVRSTNDCLLCGWGTDTRTVVGKLNADEAGQFRFKKVRTGRYYIDLGSYEGYTRDALFGGSSIGVRAGRVTSVTIVLKPVPEP